MARLNWLAELVVCCAALTVTAVDAADVGRIKGSIGAVHIERAAERLPGRVDTAVRASDIIVTGPKSSVGVTFVDQTRVSAGPNSVLVINGYAYDHVTQEGVFDATLKRGTLGGRVGKDDETISQRRDDKNPDADSGDPRHPARGLRR